MILMTHQMTCFALEVLATPPRLVGSGLETYILNSELCS